MRVPLLCVFCFAAVFLTGSDARSSLESDENKSWMDVSRARFWHEGLLYGIRRDSSRPTVHARNLFHFSGALWDCWAAYSVDAVQYLHREKVAELAKLDASTIEAGRNTCISYAAYTFIRYRFSASPGKNKTFAELDRKMTSLSLDSTFADKNVLTPAGLGLRVANTYIEYGKNDGANEQSNYATTNSYTPRNPPLAPSLPSSVVFVNDVNYWQPLALGTFIDQSGVVSSSYPAFVCPHWGRVLPFALTDANVTVSTATHKVYADPGDPPRFGPSSPTDAQWRQSHVTVLQYSGYLDPSDGVMIDISPGAKGNNDLGTNSGTGYAVNPKTGQPYVPNVVPRGDYYRVLAEFWADGPNSETPPGHWNVVLNYVSYHPQFVRKWEGKGRVLDMLEWDCRAYFTLNGGMHDTAIAVWGIKDYYDTARPITAIRWMSSKGQSSQPLGVNYDVGGIPLVPNVTEVITLSSSAPGERHAHLRAFTGQIAVRAWRNFANDSRGYAGVGWILGTQWWPYQLPTFVTPPFAGYMSGHSTYSRAAAEIMTLMTGDAYFPGGMAEFVADQDIFLSFEKGPSVPVHLQWARYYDAADESGISRIFGGIHPPIDDVPGRKFGAKLGPFAFRKASTYFPSTTSPPSSSLTTAETAVVIVIAIEVAVLIAAVSLVIFLKRRGRL